MRICARRGLVTLWLVLLASMALGQPPQGRSREREARIEHQLESVAPDAVAPFKQATAALDRNDYTAAARLYEEVLGRAPNFSPAVHRLGLSLVEAGQRQAGLEASEMTALIESHVKAISPAPALQDGDVATASSQSSHGVELN